jgi:hypothetical protein
MLLLRSNASHAHTAICSRLALQSCGLMLVLLDGLLDNHHRLVD